MAATNNRDDRGYDPYALVDSHDRRAKKEQHSAKRTWQQQRKAQAAENRQNSIQGDASGKGSFAQSVLTRPHGQKAGTVVVGAGTYGAGERDLDEWAKHGHRRRRLIVALFIILALLIAGSAGSFVLYDILRTADISAYAQTGISISGLADDDFIITPAQLADLAVVETSAAGTGQGQGGESKAGTVSAYGPSLTAFLEGYDYTIADFRTITFYCKDGYKTILRPSRMETDEVIMSFASGKEPLELYQQPLRLVIPEGDTGQWCFGILRIEFRLEGDETLTDLDILGDEAFLGENQEQRIWGETP